MVGGAGHLVRLPSRSVHGCDLLPSLGLQVERDSATDGWCGYVLKGSSCVCFPCRIFCNWNSALGSLEGNRNTLSILLDIKVLARGLIAEFCNSDFSPHPNKGRVDLLLTRWVDGSQVRYPKSCAKTKLHYANLSLNVYINFYTGILFE